MTDNLRKLLVSETMAKPHSIIAKIIHWGWVAFFIYAYSKGLDSTEDLHQTGLLAFEMIFAIVFLVLLAARFTFMHFTTPTSLPKDTPQITKTLAKLGHIGVYASMVLIALSGMGIGGVFYMNGHGEGLLMNIATGFHDLSISFGLGMIALHIGASVGHRILGDGVWSSMVPFFFKEK